jgi:hypothetical protein
LNKELYFIAIIPPSPVFEDAMELKKLFQKRVWQQSFPQLPSAHYASHAV